MCLLLSLSCSLCLSLFGPVFALCVCARVRVWVCGCGCVHARTSLSEEKNFVHVEAFDENLARAGVQRHRARVRGWYDAFPLSLALSVSHFGPVFALCLFVCVCVLFVQDVYVEDTEAKPTSLSEEKDYFVHVEAFDEDLIWRGPEYSDTENEYEDGMSSLLSPSCS